MVVNLSKLKGKSGEGVLKSQVCTLYRDVLPKWALFSQEILRHGSTFQRKKPLDMGSFIQNVQNFGCLPSKISKILKNRPIFQEKSLEMGTFFWQRVSRLGRHIPVQIKFEYPPGLGQGHEPQQANMGPY